MRRLMLLRHAKTEQDSLSGRDQDRRLDVRGQHDAPAIGSYMLANGLIPDLALVSPALRANETWELLVGAWPQRPKSELLPELYGADPSQLLRIVHATSREQASQEPRQILVVAHNPGLHEFAIGLVAAGDPSDRQALADNLPTSGLAVIDFQIDAWNEVSFRGGHMERFVSPRLLKQQHG